MSVKTKDDFEGFDDEHRDVLRQLFERYGITADVPSTTQNVINAAGAGAAAASDAMAANRGTRAQLAHDEEVLSQQRQNDFRNYSVVREGDKRESGKSAFREMQHADYVKNGGSGYKPKAGLPSYGFGPKSASDAEKDAAASYLVEQLTRGTVVAGRALSFDDRARYRHRPVFTPHKARGVMNMTLATLESQTQATVARVRADISAIRERAAGEARAESAEERAQIDTLLREATSAKAQLDRRRSDDAVTETLQQLESVGPAGSMVVRPNAGRLGRNGRRVESLGTQFVRSAAYQYIRDTRGARPQHWQSPSAELIDPMALYAATLTEDAASGGDLVIPDYRPGVVPLPFRRLVVADLIAPGTTDSNLVTYMVEKTYVNAADTVAEQGLKPESTLTFDAVSDPVRKIAHWVPVTEEMLEDVSYIRSYLDARLRFGVQLTEEDQLLNGTTVAPDLVGIRNRAGLAPPIPKGTDSIADAIFKQITAIANSAMLMPDGIVMNPLDWQTIPLMKTSSGDYVEGAGPFQRPGPTVLWGLPVAVTPAIEAGVALVGAFRTAAQIFRKGGLRVEASNSHADFFIKDLVAIRAEERLALAVYRPSAFGEVTGLAA